MRRKQLDICSECGTVLSHGTCGKGFCSKCRTYRLKIKIRPRKK